MSCWTTSPAASCCFGCDRDREQWFLEPLLAGAAVAVDRVPIQQRVLLAHLALIQAGQHVFVFVERDDPRVSTTFAASRWLISQLRSVTPDLRQTDLLRTVTSSTRRGGPPKRSSPIADRRNSRAPSNCRWGKC